MKTYNLSDSKLDFGFPRGEELKTAKNVFVKIWEKQNLNRDRNIGANYIISSLFSPQFASISPLSLGYHLSLLLYI